MNQNQYYTTEFKLQVVLHYLESDDSLGKTAKKFNLSCHALVGKWVKKYREQLVLISTNISAGDIEPQAITLTEARRYPQEFKLEVVRHYLESDDSFGQTARKFNISGHASILKWVAKFRDQIIPSEMRKPVEKDKLVLPDNPAALALRIRELEDALEKEQLKNLAINTLIDVAERDLKISIRKKSGARRSKK